jgi:hypothetical protein
LEKEANDWLRTWGEGKFDDLIIEINHQAPKLEEEGYIDGCDWASMEDKNVLLKYFKHDLESLNKDGLTKKEKFKIIERIKNKLYNHCKQSNMLENDEWNKSHLNGFSFGVMERVRKISDE